MEARKAKETNTLEKQTLSFVLKEWDIKELNVLIYNYKLNY